MVWGAFCSQKKTPLIFLKGKQTSKRYVRVIKKHLLPIYKIEENENIWFQQDNAPIHKSNYTMEALQNLPFDLLNWPPYSPDLNPIENIWSILVYKIYTKKKFYRNTDELKESILEAWEEIDLQTLQNLVDSMEDRLEKVIINRGDAIDY